MRISDVLRRKGATVTTIPGDATVSEVIELLVTQRIGAVVVSDDGARVDGIVSERDIVARLHAGGTAPGEVRVRDIMSADVVTCGLEDDLESLARTMTDRRVRHLPVVAEGRLAGIVSIGDVVKQRLDELQDERDELFKYVQQGRPAT
ncbi:CBS domain-containing protein [Georgenia thermotolerans]|uniref:CBS domain-containing protein n=1 Tax=Georgenia thermotolerans TaxID=527326 RepID=A0A7J5UNL5_9MICO|nr:CBS domain-containing protein [Georgenia thermotolerans]KAE8763959.1 CBS domain-containing protein [Georgenia thermotolerans]